MRSRHQRPGRGRRLCGRNACGCDLAGDCEAVGNWQSAVGVWRRSARLGEEAPSVLRARARNPPPPARSAGGGKAPVVFLLCAERGGDGLRRSRKTEGVLVQLTAHALGATLREAFEIVEQRGHAAEAGDDLGEGSCSVLLGRRDAWGVGVGQSEDLSRALVDQQVDAVLQGGDVGFEPDAQVGRAGDRLAAGWVFEAADDGVDVVTRDLSQPRDGVERKEDAQEGDQQIDHGREYDAGFWRRRFCGALSSILAGQSVETAREVFWPSCSFGAAPSPNLGIGEHALVLRRAALRACSG